jgi:LDH2 family malate/lactate/ureidoglycolate dehydrogenase
MRVVGAEALRAFTVAAFERVGVPSQDAAIAAEVLVSADLRAVDSHGVARLHYYIARLKQGLTSPVSRLTVERELPAAMTLDAHNSLGTVAAYHAMEMCIARATEYGSAAVCVNNSNHFGIAGYFAMMALPHDMIGVAMTNASALVVPFGGCEKRLGTNPIAFAFPGGEEMPIVVDMATSAVAYGKLEVARRLGLPLPAGWALGADGTPTTDALAAAGAPVLLPLGGLAEGVGYKGYALAVIVESLCHALAGAAASAQISAVQIRGPQPSNIGHFFAAYRVDGFRDVGEFKRDMDALVRSLHDCPAQAGVERVLVPGEKEHLATIERSRDGIPLHSDVIGTLRALAEELEIEPVAVERT